MQLQGRQISLSRDGVMLPSLRESLQRPVYSLGRKDLLRLVDRELNFFQDTKVSNYVHENTTMS